MYTQRLLLTALLLLALLAPGAAASLIQPAASQTAAMPSTSGGSMLVVENAGQWPAAARFQVWNSPLGPGTTWLAEDAIWLVVASGKLPVAGPERRADPLADLQPATLQPATLHALKLTFPGSNPDVRIEPFDPANTTVSYFIGSDPAQWRPAVPVWGGVRYVDLYPGVNLVLDGRGSGWRLETTPGSHQVTPRLRIEGADVIARAGETAHVITALGELYLPLPGSSARWQINTLAGDPPCVDAPKDASNSVAVAARPAKLAQNDSIDLVYATFLGGVGHDRAHAITVDEEGSAYITGWNESGDFPTTPGAFDPTYNAGADAFVAKLSPTGHELFYATFLGGRDVDRGHAIAVAETGNAFVLGVTDSANFPATPGAFEPTYNGGAGYFVAQLDPDGSHLVYATYLGRADLDNRGAIAVDDSGNTVITGWTWYAEFPTTPGAFDTSYNGGQSDVFVVKLNLEGSALNYGTFLGGAGWDVGTSVALDSDGNAFIAGGTSSPDFPTTPGSFDASYNGDWSDAFLVKVDAAGRVLEYSTYLGGAGGDQAEAVAIDETGNAFVTGYTTSDDFPTTPGAYDQSHNGLDDIFVAKLYANGAALGYSTFVGGSNYDEGLGIAADEEGCAWVTGFYGSGDFPSPSDLPGQPSGDLNNALAVKLNPTGNGLVYAYLIGGDAWDVGLGMAVDRRSNAYIAGYTVSSNFPTTTGAFDQSYNGGDDAFLVKLGSGVPHEDRLLWLPIGLRSP